MDEAAGLQTNLRPFAAIGLGLSGCRGFTVNPKPKVLGCLGAFGWHSLLFGLRVWDSSVEVSEISLQGLSISTPALHEGPPVIQHGSDSKPCPDDISSKP